LYPFNIVPKNAQNILERYVLKWTVVHVNNGRINGTVLKKIEVAQAKAKEGV
jgi:hypothetical protein